MEIVDRDLLKELDIPVSVLLDDNGNYKDGRIEGGIGSECEPIFKTSFEDSRDRYQNDNLKTMKDIYFHDDCPPKQQYESSNFVSFMLEGFTESISQLDEIVGLLQSLYDDIYVTKKLFDSKEIKNDKFFTNVRDVFRNCMTKKMHTRIKKVAIKPSKKIKTTIINWFIKNIDKTGKASRCYKRRTVTEKRELLKTLYNTNVSYWRLNKFRAA